MAARAVDKLVFLAGNYEAQRLAGYTKATPAKHRAVYNTVRNHFIYSCLLSDEVIQPVANYYQSRITQEITNRYKAFFRPYDTFPPIAYYAVSYKKGTYKEDAKEKAQTYTKHYPCYKDPLLREKLTYRLESLADPLCRKGKLVDTLSEDIFESTLKGGRLYKFIYRFAKSYEDTEVILKPLRQIAEERKYALISEYLQTVMPKDFSPFYLKLVRLSLLESYTFALQNLYDAYPFNALYIFYPEISFPYELNYLDTQLFQSFVRLIPDLEKTIMKGNPEQILELKYSSNFRYFRSYYKELVENLKNATMEEYENLILQDYELQKQVYQKKLEELLKDYRLVIMLYESMRETITRSKLIRTRDINFSYKDIPIYALVSEVMERFTGKYEIMLANYLRKEMYGIRKKKRKITSFLSKLDQLDYDSIIELIQNIGRVFERLPATYTNKSEEELRDHILLYLDSILEGSATGETYNKRGKTDILIRHEKTNYFIAECKFWRGEKRYLDAITQLLDYLTWRDVSAALVIFVRNKNFSSVIRTISKVTPSHPNYIGFANKKDESWVNYLFHSKGDPKNQIKVAILLFHVPH